MARTASLLIALASASLSVAAPQHLFGIPKSLVGLYSASTFTCLDKSKTIDSSAVNDDFCDCADGSDEPGTSACALGKFYCANKGYRGKYIHSSLVNDGVCDCCDGTDEYAGRASCKNTCDVDGAEWRAQQAELIRKAEEGARLRKEYEEAGKAAAIERARKIAESTAALEAAKAAREAAEAAVAAAEAEETKVTEARRLEAEQQAAIAAAEQAKIVEHAAETGTQDALVEKAQQATGDATANWPEVPAEGATDGAPALEATPAPATPTPVPTPEPYRSPEGDKARDVANAARSEESRLERELRSTQDDNNIDFGPEGVFYKLKGQCFDLRVNQYTYQACPFGSAKQDHTSLGTFSGWSKRDDGSTDYSAMLFSNGQHCWNGPNRSLKIIFECGDNNALLSADEPEKCTYAARFSTPAACDGKFAENLKLQLDSTGDGGAVDAAHLKDEL